MAMSNLPVDLVVEILCRVPLASLKAVRSTCKIWNALANDGSFKRKHIAKAAKEREFVMMLNGKVYLININLHETHHNNFDLTVNRKGKLVTQENPNKVYYISKVFHCNGLLVCRLRDTDIQYKFVVWNPYCGKQRWVKHRRRNDLSIERFAFGYDKSCGTHKILRFFDCSHVNWHEIYDLSSNSWRNFIVSVDWHMKHGQHGVSSKGNSYWYAMDSKSRRGFLLCFDFTRERFGPRLPLPFETYGEYTTMSLSSVRDEQLAVLHVDHLFEIRIWVTKKIDPDAVLWSSFLKVDPEPDISRFCLSSDFLIDEERRIAVFIDSKRCNNTAYIIGEKGNIKRVKRDEFSYTHLCPYFRTSVQIE